MSCLVNTLPFAKIVDETKSAPRIIRVPHLVQPNHSGRVASDANRCKPPKTFGRKVPRPTQQTSIRRHCRSRLGKTILDKRSVDLLGLQGKPESHQKTANHKKSHVPAIDRRVGEKLFGKIPVLNREFKFVQSLTLWELFLSMRDFFQKKIG